jgi:hypothetical protein
MAQERARLAARRLEHVKIYVGNTHRLHQPQVRWLACPVCYRLALQGAHLTTALPACL